jgi:hypothetical protein
MNRQDFMAAVDWPKVAAEMREHRSDLEVRIAQHVAELRAAVRPERRRDKEQLAAWQANIDAIDEVTAARPRVITYPSGWRAFAVEAATLLPPFVWRRLRIPRRRAGAARHEREFRGRSITGITECSIGQEVPPVRPSAAGLSRRLAEGSRRAQSLPPGEVDELQVKSGVRVDVAHVGPQCVG